MQALIMVTCLCFGIRWGLNISKTKDNKIAAAGAIFTLLLFQFFVNLSVTDLFQNCLMLCLLFMSGYSFVQETRAPESV
jgi:hypothetical protein